MEHLTPGQVADLRAELEQQLRKLEKSMKVTDEALKTVELDQTAVGRLSRIDSLQNQGIAKGLRERESVRLALIEGALRRMDSGTYAICTTCEKPIGIERLFIFPESVTCADCTG